MTNRHFLEFFTRPNGYEGPDPGTWARLVNGALVGPLHFRDDCTDAPGDIDVAELMQEWLYTRNSTVRVSAVCEFVIVMNEEEDDDPLHDTNPVWHAWKQRRRRRESGWYAAP